MTKNLLHTLYTSYPNKTSESYTNTTTTICTTMQDKMIESFFSFREKLKNRVSSIIITSLAKYADWLEHKSYKKVHPVFILLLPHYFLLAKKLWVSKENTEHCYKKVRAQFSCLLFLDTLVSSKF